ncbi:FAD binding domain-containing protein [Myceligenerans crystallogenes]|uniref:FAD-binding PCMH-type domain-containing protein n=1 Tax=Myceligenerans crystallogenes TaxID=316335 RepID=A0ABP4ZST5_9MICO
MRPRPFHLLRPRTLDEALEAWNAPGADAALLAGGQSLVADLNAGHRTVGTVIDIKGIRELDELALSGDVLRIGALTTHEQLAGIGEGDLPPALAAVPRVARTVAPRPIRVRGTVVGNLAAGFRGATWPALLGAYGTTVEARTPDGRTARGDVRDAVRFAAERYVVTALEVPAGRKVGWAEATVRASGRSCRVACGVRREDDGTVTAWLSGLAPVVVRHENVPPADEALGELARSAVAGASAPARTARPAGPEDETELWRTVVHTVLRRARNDLEEEAA